MGGSCSTAPRCGCAGTAETMRSPLNSISLTPAPPRRWRTPGTARRRGPRPTGLPRQLLRLRHRHVLHPVSDSHPAGVQPAGPGRPRPQGGDHPARRARRNRLVTHDIHHELEAHGVGEWVTFERDEPICMIVPVRRGEIERFAPVIKSITDNPELAAAWAAWNAGRNSANTNQTPDGPPLWQSDYMKGRRPDGAPAPEHQVRLRLRPPFIESRCPAGGSPCQMQPAKETS